MRHPKRPSTALVLSLCIAASALFTNSTSAKSHPAPYYPGTIAPDHLSQPDMDQQLATFYKAWKAIYLSDECGSGRYFVKVNADHQPVGGDTAPGTITVSEAHGYGMLISVMMADYDTDAQKIFDGMVRYFEDHPATSDPGLMAWNQIEGCGNSTGRFRGDVSATDGDLDIAYALLLADQKWGSQGTIDYRSEANAVLAAILKHEVHPRTHHLMIGDWAGTDGDHEIEYTTRSSDFMPSHLYGFYAITGDKRWQDVRNKTYSIINTFNQRYTPKSALLPDFISHLDTSMTPARAELVGDKRDGDYAWNAARYPWRVGLDYLLYGDPRSLETLTVFNRWARSTTHDDPAAFNSGYRIDGGALADEGNNALAFVSTLGVSAMISADNQPWVNSVWDNLQRQPIEDNAYYGNTLKLLSMVIMSGHWERPRPAPSQKPAHVSVNQQFAPTRAPMGSVPIAVNPPARLELARGFTFRKLLRRRGLG